MIFVALLAIPLIPLLFGHTKAQILESRYFTTTRGMSEPEVREVMGELTRPTERQGGVLYWDYNLDEDSRVVREDGSIQPKTSSRVAKTIQYSVNLPPYTFPPHVDYLFMFSPDGTLVGRHLHDYD